MSVKDKLRNSGSGYAIEVRRKALVKVWGSEGD